MRNETSNRSSNQTPNGTPPTNPSGGARGVVQEAKQTVAQITDEARAQAAANIDSTKDRIADRVDSVARALRDSTSQMRQNETDGAAAYLDKAAQGAERLSNYLRSAEPADVLRKVERFARRE